MSAVQANCPACGGPVRFKISSAVVTVCEYCRSVVARGDRKLEDLGKVSEVTDTGAVLELGFRGRYDGVPFELVGRAQLGHEAGGVWDEWYAAFADGRWGWLAEAQGRYALTFQEPAEVPGLPSFEEMAVGGTVRLPPGKRLYVVAEKGVARPLAAQGEMPYLLQPGATYRYADLSGREGRFGTLDYGDTPPRVFTGHEVTLEQLGFDANRRLREREARQVDAAQLNCPQCAGPLLLRAPDKTERVGCPNCGSLLDVKEGKLALLQALSTYKVESLLPLGSVGKFPEGELTVIGYMQRATTVEGVDYFWEEYLLYEPRVGFRWLVQERNHWNYVKPVPPADVEVHAQKAAFQNKAFRLFQKGEARVTCVTGEFYWKVTIDERTDTADFIAPPEVLSWERAQFGNAEEINWSLGTYWPRADIEKAFGLTGLPTATGVALNQPFLHGRIYKRWGIFLLAALVLGLIFLALRTGNKVHESQYTVTATAPALPTTTPVGTPPAVPPAQDSKVYFSDHFELKPRRNVALTLRTNIASGGVYVEGELVHKETGETQPFFVELGMYVGVEDGEAWSEDIRKRTIYLSAQPAGQYSMRLEVVPEKPGQTFLLSVQVEQGVQRLVPWFFVVGALSVIPVCVGLYHIFFEQQRWQESNLAGAAE